MRILVVDDEAVEREFLCHLLRENFPNEDIVGEARDGREAVRLAESLRPNVVFLDVKMPLMDGITAAKIIRDSFLCTEVVILSAYGEFSYAQEAIRFGATAYLLKPVDENEIVNIMYQLVRNRMRIQSTGTAPSDTQSVTTDDTLNEVLHYIDQHISDDINLSHLAQHAMFHPKYLSRLFKQKFGFGISEYISTIRLDRASSLLLKFPSLSIQSIAIECGFNNVSYFNASFRSRFGCSPTSYRSGHIS